MCNCFKNYKNKLEEENTINGHKPIISKYVSRSIDVMYKIWSEEQQKYWERYKHTTIKINFCPFCGEKLQDGGYLE